MTEESDKLLKTTGRRRLITAILFRLKLNFLFIKNLIIE